jgi:hypothetical protein
MCNIPIYLCNIDIKHLQHTPETSEILETSLVTCAFSAISPFCLDEWRLVVAELDAGTEVSGGATSHKASPLACLLEHLSWRLADWVEQPRRASNVVEAGGAVERRVGKVGDVVDSE